MFHVSGMIAVLLTGAAFPTTLVFPAPGPWDPRVWLELTARHKVTSWSGVPTQFWRMLRHPDASSYDLSSVMTVGGGGEPQPIAEPDRGVDRCWRSSPGDRTNSPAGRSPRGI